MLTAAPSPGGPAVLVKIDVADVPGVVAGNAETPFAGLKEDESGSGPGRADFEDQVAFVGPEGVRLEEERFAVRQGCGASRNPGFSRINPRPGG